MQQSDIKQTILATHLFDKMAELEKESIYAELALESVEYKKGELIGGLFGPQNAIGIIISGLMQAMKYQINGDSVFLRQFKPGHVFGLGSVFCKVPTKLSYMEARQLTLVAYIGENELIRLLKNQQILINYLQFTNTKIRYLNTKIEVLSQSTIADRLLVYLYDQWLVQGQENPIRLSMSYHDLASYIGVSRASLYRVLAELEREKVLQRQNKYIIIRDDFWNRQWRGEEYG